MRYENPFTWQRRRPQPICWPAAAFSSASAAVRLSRLGMAPRRSATRSTQTRRGRRRALFSAAIAAAGVVRADAGGAAEDALLAVQPQSPGLADRIWWGSGSRETAIWAGENGTNLMSSTLLLEDTQVPFDELQAEQIELFREAWRKAAHERAARLGQPQRHAGHLGSRPAALRLGRNEDQVGWLDGAISRFGRTYTGEPDRIAAGARRRRSRSGRGYDSPHGSEPARRRVQRRDARDDRQRELHPRSAGRRTTTRRQT